MSEPTKPAGVRRREFLKVIGVGTAATAAACTYAGPEETGKLIPYLVSPDQTVPGVSTYYATLCRELDCSLVHFSSDYVFDGASQRPYLETSEPFPLSIYGNSKLAGEYLVRTCARKYFLIRSCGLYGKAGSRGKGADAG